MNLHFRYVSVTRRTVTVVLLVTALTTVGCAREQDTELTPSFVENSTIPLVEANEPTDVDIPAVENTQPPRNDAVHIGVLLPQTGQLSGDGAAAITAVQLAVNDINEAGGVRNEPIVLFEVDETDSIETAQTNVGQLLEEDPIVVIGPLGFQTDSTVSESITNAGVAQCLPSYAGARNGPASPLRFQTVPSEAVHSDAIADQIAVVGQDNVAVITRSDPYVQTLTASLRSSIQARELTLTEIGVVEPTLEDLTDVVETVLASGPSMIVVIAGESVTDIVDEVLQQGVLANQVLVVSDDETQLRSLPSTVSSLDGLSLSGARAITTWTSTERRFNAALRQLNPELDHTLFAAEAYDCTVITALATIATGSLNPETIMAEVPAVTRVGTKCTSFAECAALLQNGENIDYEGLTGPVEIDEQGRPTTGQYRVFEFNADGELVNLDDTE